MMPQEPQNSWEIFSFDREALVNLGFYKPGKTATLNSPAFTGAKFPRAVVAHELVHQSLIINSKFGYFTQLLNMLRSRGFVSERAHETCHKLQWTVQEATATYVELTHVARHAPAELADEIRALPTSRNAQPPYREAFNTIASWLPLDVGDDEVTLRAKAMLVESLAIAAMNTDCLRRGLADAPSDEVLFDCMRECPNDRFTRLLAQLGTVGAYSSLLDVLRRHIVDDDVNENEVERKGFLRNFYKSLRPLLEHVIAWGEDDDLQEETERLLDFWRPFLKYSETRHCEDPPLPKVTFGAERARWGLEQYPPQPLPDGAVAEFAAEATKRKLAIIIELALRDPSLAHVKLGAYIPARQTEPWPAGDISEEQSAAIPQDLRGLTPPETLLRELEAFPNLPRIVVLLLPGGSRHFAAVPGSTALFRRAIRVYRLLDLSLECVKEARQEDVGEEFLILSYAPSPLRLGCILGGEACALVRMTSDAEAEIFAAICDRLGMRVAEDPDSFRRDRDVVTLAGISF